MARARANFSKSHSSEQTARLKSLRSGPWSKKARLAVKKVALSKVHAIPSSTEPSLITFDGDFSTFERALRPLKLSLVFTDIEKDKQEWLKTVLRAHWVGAIEEAEIPVRASLDEALTYLQLCELAVETGYITLDAARAAVRDDLVRLLWAAPVQQYVRQYDYISVAFLASRFNIDIGYGDLQPPPIDVRAESRFAQFLSQHRLFYGNGVARWLLFLDDYWTLGDEISDKDLVDQFLRSTTPTAHDEQILTLISGAEQFLTLLSDFYETLEEHERPRYGLFYLYWMAKMMGWDSNASGFFRDPEQLDWCEAIASSKRLRMYFDDLQQPQSDRAPDTSQTLWTNYSRAVTTRGYKLSRWWQETVNFIAPLKVARIVNRPRAQEA